MQPHHSYSVPYAGPTPSSKYSSSHSTSSAFSASANPNEDWTKISDLAERRRIQNRIAQRNYRKKIKRRLEDLEKRAGSSSSSPEQIHAELAPVHARRNSAAKKQKSKPEPAQRHERRRSPEPFMTNEVKSEVSPHQYGRDSLSPPPSFNYPTYSLPDPMVHSSYPQHAPYNALPSPFPDYPEQAQYLPSVSNTLPSMPSYQPSPSKQGGFFDDEDVLNQYNMGYSPFTSMDIPMQQQYQDSNAHVNIPEYSFPYFQ